MTSMSSVRQMFRSREAGVATMTIVLATGVSILEPRLLEAGTLQIVLLGLPLLLVGAIGQLTVMLARHVDLSIGSILGLSAICAGLVFRDAPGLPLAVGFAVALGCGALLGFINGILVAAFSLPSIIVTLGTLSLYRGLVFIVSGGRQIDPNHIPTALIQMSQPSALGVPWIVLLAAAVALAAHALLSRTRIGREVHAIGSNPVAAPLRGIRVRTVTVFVFTLSGLLAGLAGVLYASRYGYVNPSITGVGFEFSVIAAVVIGGTSIQGGVGSVPGVALGVLFIAMVQVALPLLGVSGYVQTALYGAIIIGALAVDRTVRAAALRLAA